MTAGRMKRLDSEKFREVLEAIAAEKRKGAKALPCESIVKQQGPRTGIPAAEFEEMLKRRRRE